MKTNELRIGNYLMTNHDYLCEVELIHKNHFDCRETTTGNFIPNGEYKPIQLTEEWIMKFGLKKMPITEYTQDTYDFFGFKLWVKNGKFLFDDRIEIKYIHTLQNLFYSLVEQELTLQP